MTYDWRKLERKYVYNKKYAASSLRNFAKEEGIPYNAYFKERTKNWTEKKRLKQDQISTTIEAKLTEEIVLDSVEANKRHIGIFNILLDQVVIASGQTKIHVNDKSGKEKTLKSILPAKLKALAQIAEIAQKGQRLALGMDKPDNTGAEEKLGAMLDSMQEAFTEDESGGG